MTSNTESFEPAPAIPLLGTSDLVQLHADYVVQECLH